MSVTSLVIENWEVLDLLASLVQKSLVVYEEEAQAGGRYRLLETVRQYSRDRLLEAGEGEAVRDRHASFFLALAEEGEPELWRDLAWLDRLETEHDNLRASLEWCAAGDTQQGLQMAGALRWFWYLRGHFAEARWQLEAVLAGRASVEPAVRVKALCAGTHALADDREFEPAMALGEESLAICRQAGDKAGTAWSLLAYRRPLWGQWDLARSEALAAEALSLFREVGDPRGTALALVELGESLEFQGYAERALELLEESLALCRREGYQMFTPLVLDTLARLVLDRGQPEAAKSLWEESLASWRGIGNRIGIQLALSDLAQVAQCMGDYGRATALYEESLTVGRELGYHGADRLLGMASVAQARGEYARARALLEEAQALGQGAGARTSEGRLLIEMGDYAAARSRFEAALALRRQEQNARRIAWALLDVGHAAWLQGEPDVTRAHAGEALGLFQELDDKDGVLAALESLAVAALARGPGGEDPRSGGAGPRGEASSATAARVIGAVEGQREILGLQGRWRRPRERLGEAVRAASPERAFAAARAEGRAMTWEAAVAYALGELEAVGQRAG